MNPFSRLWRHVSAPAARRCFPDSLMNTIQSLIASGEVNHDAQVCFAVESRLPLDEVLGRRNTRHRAEEVFVNLRVWDTERNTGVLIYILLADHAIEIVVDRKVAASVTQQEWEHIHTQMAAAFARKDWKGGALEGIEAVHQLLARHLPRSVAVGVDELPDRPVIL